MHISTTAKFAWHRAHVSESVVDSLPFSLQVSGTVDLLQFASREQRAQSELYNELPLHHEPGIYSEYDIAYTTNATWVEGVDGSCDIAAVTDLYPLHDSIVCAFDVAA